MNYGLMLKQHNQSGADVTLGTIQIDPDETYRFGVMEVDPDNRITGFEEKPTFTKLRSPRQSRQGASVNGNLSVQHRRPHSHLAEGRRR